MSLADDAWRALAAADGTVAGVAVDHRDSMQAALRAARIFEPDDDLVVAIKVDVVRELANLASVVLVDASATWPALLAAGALPHDVAVVVPLEAQGYGAAHEIDRTRLLDHPTPGEAAAAGAAACKLLLPFRADHPQRARTQLHVAAATTEACHGAGLPLVLEPIVWAMPGEQLDDERRAELVVEAAHLLSPLRPGLLKLQYPGSASACASLHEACDEHPWVLLGGGCPIDQLVVQVREACRAGARGFIVGRSLFAPALTRDVAARRAALHGEARPSFARLAAAARA